VRGGLLLAAGIPVFYWFKGTNRRRASTINHTL
jgi:hypothetical protein